MTPVSLPVLVPLPITAVCGFSQLGITSLAAIVGQTDRDTNIM